MHKNKETEITAASISATLAKLQLLSNLQYGEWHLVHCLQFFALIIHVKNTCFVSLPLSIRTKYTLTKIKWPCDIKDGIHGIFKELLQPEVFGLKVKSFFCGKNPLLLIYCFNKKGVQSRFKMVINRVLARVLPLTALRSLGLSVCRDQQEVQAKSKCASFSERPLKTEELYWCVFNNHCFFSLNFKSLSSS